jgi:hypothetical protein
MEDEVSRNKANLIQLTNVYLAFNLEGAPSILYIAAQSRNSTPLTYYIPQDSEACHTQSRRRSASLIASLRR